MRKEYFSFKSNSYNKQRGVALLILLFVLGSGALYALLSTLNQNNLQIERDKKTAEALALAKQALIGFAVSKDLQPGGAERPGDLPCPDMNDDGSAEAICGNPAGSNQSTRLGRLPWKTLKLPELRDGYGEHLWYAVSNNYKNNNRHFPLNSNTNGTISIRDASGNIINNGSTATGAIAVIIAPGPPLSRLGVLQVRSGAGINNPNNYLDVTAAEDNGAFIDGTQDGFIYGNPSNINNQMNNDQISVITREELMPLIIKRVEGEVRQYSVIGTPHRISTTDPNGWWLINDWQALYRLP
jgi:hypothetical protein